MKLRPPTDTGALPNVLWKPLPKQALALSCPVDDILFGGAVGGGKTDFLLADWVQHAATFGSAAVGILVRRTLPELRDIVKRAHRMFPRLGARWNKSERMWTFPNGATLLLSYLESLEDATRYNGQEFTWVGVDEAGGYKSPEPIDYLRSRMRSVAEGLKARMVLTANPGGRGHGWLMERYVKGRTPYVPFDATNPETGEALDFQRVYIPSRLTDNPYLMADKSYVSRIRGSGPSWFVKAILMGDWNIAIAGKIFLRDWWRYYKPIPADTEDPRSYAERHLGVYHIVQSCDFAARAKESNDRSVVTTWGATRNGWLVLDCWAGRLTFPDLKRQAIALAEKWRCFDVLIEDASSGIGIIDELKRDTKLAIRPVKPVGGKYERALAVSPLIEQGLVLLPERAPWLSDFLDEVGGFPEAPHDDIVDSISQALQYLSTRYTVGETGPLYTPVPPASRTADKPTFQTVQERDEYEDSLADDSGWGSTRTTFFR